MWPHCSSFNKHLVLLVLQVTMAPWSGTAWTEYELAPLAGPHVTWAVPTLYWMVMFMGAQGSGENQTDGQTDRQILFSLLRANSHLLAVHRCKTKIRKTIESGAKQS